MSARGSTRERILEAARDIARTGGPGELTFDAVARRIGVSKQAVIYWFPKKEDLIAGVGIPLLREEAQAGIGAIRAAADAAEAVSAFVEAIGAFHFSDIDRFRLMYIAPQMWGRPGLDLAGSLGDQVHALTSSMYDALEAKLIAGSGLQGAEARRTAVAIHMAVLGLVTMVSLTEAVGDPLLHDKHDLLQAMARLLAGQVRHGTEA